MVRRPCRTAEDGRMEFRMRQRTYGEACQRTGDQEEDEEKLHAEAEARPIYWRG